MNSLNKTILLACASIIGNFYFTDNQSLQAQTDSNVYNERVVVTSRYRPVISDIQKLNVAPGITDTVSTMNKDFTYDINSRRLTSLYIPSRIKAARIIGEPATRLYNNYLKLGFGNYWSPLAEFYYNSLRSKEYTYGIRATHHSSWGTIGKTSKDDTLPSPTYYGQAPFSNTDIALFGKLVTRKNLQLSANLGYQNDFSRYYGFSDSTLHAVTGNPRDSIKRGDYAIAYNHLYLDLGMKTLNTNTGALGYEANLNIADMFASYSQNEFNINFDGNIHYGFTMAKKYQGVAFLHLTYNGYTTHYSPASLPLGADSALLAALVMRDSAGTPLLNKNNYLNLYKANPYIDFLFEGFQVHVGGVVALDAYNVPAGGKVHIYPDAMVSRTFLHDIIHLSAYALGNVDANSWNTIRQINPYIAPCSEVRATSHYDFGANARFSLSKKLNFGLNGSYNIIDNDLSFVLDNRYTLNNVFKPHYDSINRIKIGAVAQFINDEMLQIEMRGNYYIYKNRCTELVGEETKELPLFYRPSFDASLGATVNYLDKVIGRIEFQLIGKSAYATAISDDGTEGLLYLPLRYGLNLEVEYRHNKALSFFLKADNLLFQRYFYWQNYPSYRGLFIAGLTYTIN